MTGTIASYLLRNGESDVGSLATLDSNVDRGVAVGGERSLMLAILFDGIQSFISFACAQSEKEREPHREAMQWINDKKSDYVFSFDNVCECLGINPQYLRSGLINAANSQSYEWRKMRRNF